MRWHSAECPRNPRTVNQIRPRQACSEFPRSIAIFGVYSVPEKLVWGAKARDKAPPVRVEDAFPVVISTGEFRSVATLLESRAPSNSHPRRSASSYLLSGLVKCQRCDKDLSGQESKSGKFAYYVCQSLMKRGSKACDAPRLNSKRFEGLIVG